MDYGEGNFRAGKADRGGHRGDFEDWRYFRQRKTKARGETIRKRRITVPKTKRIVPRETPIEELIDLLEFRIEYGHVL